ncbi:MAG: hypothetical protein C6P37_10445 [Caldibacillus debilis]|uniref:Uncharacterized protein n=1 Tax=Caldibacillus debilis TaxID=301148 RepID=A0A3E0K3F3_9BACI|nr:hypothetical protein [Bacillaceae bacterium]OUM83538.1 MAG: hypothetical protein BAA03_09485 [Caldibacillus debilis]MBY6273275.1 hypothetical protein [Bacillaceae bacterium]REJ18100.1 MAG: hypothetical protein C6W57_04310 [Caldibacillus debilis]REJ27866.1 MAG: hypothetical protein C6P37_10445 [Caldibacillus debilis]
MRERGPIQVPRQVRPVSNGPVGRSVSAFWNADRHSSGLKKRDGPDPSPFLFLPLKECLFFLFRC